MAFVYFIGATAFEIQIGRLWARFPYWRFIVVGCRPTIGWDNMKEQE